MKQLPQMNPYPAEQSVLVLDNCRIHHNNAIVELVHAAGQLLLFQGCNISEIFTGCLILYLPAYSPDLNPIEESFSACKSGPIKLRYMVMNWFKTVKAYIKRHGHHLRKLPNPILALLEACSCITPDSCRGWFRHAGYMD